MKRPKLNYSGPFLVPALELTTYTGSVQTGLIQTYLAVDDEIAGDHLYLLYDADTMEEDLKSYIEASELWTETITPTDGQWLFKFKFSEEIKDTVVRPFLAGKYSEISREYVVKYFPKEGKRSLHRKILDKDPSVREYQEQRIGMALPDDAEVWSRTTLTKETYVWNLEFDTTADLGI